MVFLKLNIKFNNLTLSNWSKNIDEKLAYLGKKWVFPYDFMLVRKLSSRAITYLKMSYVGPIVREILNKKDFNHIKIGEIIFGLGPSV